MAVTAPRATTRPFAFVPRTVAAIALWAGLVALALPSIVGPFDVRLTVGTVVAVAAAIVGFFLAPVLAQRVSWKLLCVAAAAAAFAWALALSFASGWSGPVDPVRGAGEYLAAARSIESPALFLSSFTTTLGEYGTHVRGHPPGMPLLLWGLARLGLGSAAAAATVMIAAGAAAVPAAMVAIRRIADEQAARRAMPFLALAPAAVWIATSGDALFAGVGAWAVALAIVATSVRGRRATIAAAGAGLLFGAALMLTYGAALLAAVPAVVVWRRRRFDVIAPAAAATVVVLGAFAAAGFWWPAGLLATRREYLAGIAPHRGYWFFLLANLGAFGLACGPALAASLTRIRTHRVAPLIAGAALAILLADLSGMSKGEVERIWLLFVPWMLIATAALPNARRWLAAQIVVALAVQTFIATPW